MGGPEKYSVPAATCSRSLPGVSFEMVGVYHKCGRYSRSTPVLESRPGEPQVLGGENSRIKLQNVVRNTSEKYNGDSGQELGRLTVEQVRRAVNTWIATADSPPAIRRKRYQRETEKILYYRRRNEQARKSHTKTRLKRLKALEIDIDQLESCIPKDY